MWIQHTAKCCRDHLKRIQYHNFCFSPPTMTVAFEWSFPERWINMFDVWCLLRSSSYIITLLPSAMSSNRWIKQLPVQAIICSRIHPEMSTSISNHNNLYHQWQLHICQWVINIPPANTFLSTSAMWFLSVQTVLLLQSVSRLTDTRFSFFFLWSRWRRDTDLLRRDAWDCWCEGSWEQILLLWSWSRLWAERDNQSILLKY